MPVSGLYVVRIVDDRQRTGLMVPLVVRDDRPADLLDNSAVLTAQRTTPGAAPA